MDQANWLASNVDQIGLVKMDIIILENQKLVNQ